MCSPSACAACSWPSPVPDAYTSRGLLFGASYCAARLVLYPLVQCTYRGIGFNPFTAGAAISGPLLLAGGFAHGTARIALWALAAVVDLIVPYLTRHQLTRVPFQPTHLAERYAGLVIIALGESVVDTGLAVGRLPLTPARLAAVAVAFALACALWWVYFAFAATAIRHAPRTAQIPIEVIRPVLPYGHLAFTGGIIAIAAGIGQVVAHPLAHLHIGIASLLFGGASLYLATFGCTRWRMFHTLSRTRLGAAAACLALLPANSGLPALACLVTPTAVIVGLNAAEAHMICRTRTAPQR